MKALNRKVQKKAMVQKRSAIYTVMQNKFIGNNGQATKVFERKTSFLTYCYSH